MFGPNDFDFNMSFSKPSHLRSGGNNISVGTLMGLITFNPATLKKSNYQPKVIFCSSIIAERRVGTYPAQG